MLEPGLVFRRGGAADQLQAPVNLNRVAVDRDRVLPLSPKQFGKFDRHPVFPIAVGPKIAITGGTDGCPAFGGSAEGGFPGRGSAAIRFSSGADAAEQALGAGQGL